MSGYNPNRDSGQAIQRGFIEVPKDKIPSGLIEEYGFTPAPTQRYFAQLVYNIGSGGDSNFTAADRVKFEQLITLIPYIDLLVATTGIKMETLDIPVALTQETFTLSDVDTLIPVTLENTTGEYSIIEDVNNIDNDDKTEFLLNVLGYVSAVECYVWINQEEGISSDKTERFLPKIAYEKPTPEFPYGKSTIYFSRFDWNDIGALPEEKRIIRVHYLKLPVQQ